MDKRTLERGNYITFCGEFDLNPEWLGKKITDNGKTYTISGLNTRSKKFPVTTLEGTSFNASYLKALIKGTTKEWRKQKDADFRRKTAEELKQARKAYGFYCTNYGLPKDWLDKTFVNGRKTYRIEGIKEWAKYPVVCRSTDGKVMFFAADFVCELMKRQYP